MSEGSPPCYNEASFAVLETPLHELLPYFVGQDDLTVALQSARGPTPPSTTTRCSHTHHNEHASYLIRVVDPRAPARHCGWVSLISERLQEYAKQEADGAAPTEMATSAAPPKLEDNCMDLDCKNAEQSAIGQMRRPGWDSARRRASLQPRQR